MNSIVRLSLCTTTRSLQNPSTGAAATLPRLAQASNAGARLAAHAAFNVARRTGNNTRTCTRRNLQRAVTEDTSAKTEEESEELEDDDSLQLAVKLAEVADGVKAEDVLVLHVAPVCDWSRYFVIVTARSRPQMDAIMIKMRDAARQDFGREFNKNPESNSQAWAVMDLGDVVAHIFTAQEREYYDLESFYAGADEVVMPFTQSPSDRW